MQYKLKPKPLHSFKQIRFPQEKNVRKCECGALTSSFICPNCGKEKRMLKKYEKYMAKRAEQYKEQQVFDNMIASFNATIREMKEVEAQNTI